MNDPLAKARAIAAAATPGPWIHAPRNQVYVDNGPAPLTVALTHIGARDRREADAAHIATFDPPTIEAMLDAIEAAEGYLKLDLRRRTLDDAGRLADALDRVRETIGDNRE